MPINCQVVWKPLVLELARRGHHVTLIGPVPDKDFSTNPNITFAHTNNDLEKSLNSTSVFLGENPLIPISSMIETGLQVLLYYDSCTYVLLS